MPFYRVKKLRKTVTLQVRIRDICNRFGGKRVSSAASLTVEASLCLSLFAFFLSCDARPSKAHEYPETDSGCAGDCG